MPHSGLYGQGDFSRQDFFAIKPLALPRSDSQNPRVSRLQAFKAGVWRFCRMLSPRLEHELRRRFSRSYYDNWGYRTRVACACPDNAFIPRVPNAGAIEGEYQILHNGLRVLRGSYYGKGPERLFRRNRGVHEPQEERVFQEVLKTLAPGSVMIELGAYWAFYSMWFCKEVPRARAYMVEPVAENLAFGQRNFAANGMTGHFTHALVGQHSGTAQDGTPIICVDDFVAQNGIEHVHLLHSDIQGYEVDMLRGCEKTVAQNRISWFFISTHNEELHAACEAFLRTHHIAIEASITTAESYSTDGVLVGRAAHVPAIPPIALSRRKA